MAATETKAEQSTELVRLRNRIAEMKFKADASRRTEQAAAAEQSQAAVARVGQAQAEQAEQKQEEALPGKPFFRIAPLSPLSPRAGGVICYFLEIRDVPRFP